jgi:sigma-70-like protein
MRKIEEVLRLHVECGRSNREIAAAVRISPSTVSDYLRRAKLARLGWPLPEGMTERALEAALFPVQPASKVKRPEPDWGEAHREMGRENATDGQIATNLSISAGFWPCVRYCFLSTGVTILCP